MDAGKFAQFIGQYGSGFIFYIASVFDLKDRESPQHGLSKEDGSILVFALLSSIATSQLGLRLGPLVPEKTNTFLYDVFNHVSRHGAIWTFSIVLLIFATRFHNREIGWNELASSILRVLPPCAVIASTIGSIISWIFVLFVPHVGNSPKTVFLVYFFSSEFINLLIVTRYLPFSIMRSGVSSRSYAIYCTFSIVMINLMFSVSSWAELSMQQKFGTGHL